MQDEILEIIEYTMNQSNYLNSWIQRWNIWNNWTYNENNLNINISPIFLSCENFSDSFECRYKYFVNLGISKIDIIYREKLIEENEIKINNILNDNPDLLKKCLKILYKKEWDILKIVWDRNNEKNYNMEYLEKFIFWLCNKFGFVWTILKNDESLISLLNSKEENKIFLLYNIFSGYMEQLFYEKGHKFIILTDDLNNNIWIKNTFELDWIKNNKNFNKWIIKLPYE